MYSFKNVAIISTILIFISCNKVDENEEILQIEKTFNKYQKALLNNNGQEAIKYLDNQTLNYYSNLLSQVTFKNKKEIEQLALFDQYCIYFIRAYIGEKKILSLQNNESKFFIFLVNSGLINIDSLSKQSIKNIKIDNYSAKADIFINGSQTSLQYYFSKEHGQWKVDATPLLPSIKAEFSKQINNFKESISIVDNNIIIEYIEEKNPELSTHNIEKPFK